VTSILRTPGVILSLVSVAVVVGVASPAAAIVPEAAPETVPNTVEYVALGDSYAAGVGLEPATGYPVAGCLQSELDYPHSVATQLGLDLVDVSCSGAETKNLIARKQKTGSGTAPVQSDALSDSTDLVTITIGGNDLGFIDLAGSCVALSRSGPIISGDAADCRTNLEAAEATPEQRIRTDVVGSAGDTSSSGLTAAFAAVREKAPNAEVFVVGYPSIMPDEANTPASGCYRAEISGSSLATLKIDNGFPFTDTDVSYIRSLQQKLDKATADAADAAGFTYVSLLESTAAHSACQTDGSAYVNGITFTSSRDHTISMPAGSIHPNAAGAAFVAQTVAPLVEAALAPPTPEATATPSTPVAGFSPPWLLIGLVGVVVVVAIIAITVVRRRRARS
jgi:lysophospholipase L1-like esterase